MADEADKEVMKSLPVAQPERKPFEKADQEKVNDAKSMPELPAPPKGRVEMKDGTVIDHN